MLHWSPKSALVAAVLVLGGCPTEPSSDMYDPLSTECEACLEGGGDSGIGCSAEFDACTAEASCDDAAICELRNHCYERPADGNCASESGCRITGDSGSAEQVRAAFEQCARTTCASRCGFVAP
jgi:hypothetical protein